MLVADNGSQKTAAKLAEMKGAGQKLVCKQ